MKLICDHAGRYSCCNKCKYGKPFLSENYSSTLSPKFYCRMNPLFDVCVNLVYCSVQKGKQIYSKKIMKDAFDEWWPTIHLEDDMSLKSIARDAFNKGWLSKKVMKP